MSVFKDCPQCGSLEANFLEGICVDCWKENQVRLDAHNFNFDRWENLTDKQRDDEISKAI